MTKQTKSYQPPTIKVVQFMIERGYYGTIDTVIDTPKNTLGMYNDVNDADDSWNSSFTTGGENESHF